MLPVEAIDTRRYPIESLSSPEAKEMIRDAQAQLDRTGACELPGFLTPNAIDEIVTECAALESQAFRNSDSGNAYLVPTDKNLPDDHPARLEETTKLGVIAYDQFPAASLLRRVYEWDTLMQFVGSVLALPKIYRYADEMGGLNLAVMQPGDYLRWHFDQTDFVTSIALQSAEAGGEFEYVPMIRNSSAENFGEVRRVLKGDSDRIIPIANAPGTFVLFKGRHSIHRVTAIKGNRSRLMALLGYDSREGVKSSEYLRRIRYGRVEPYTGVQA